MGFFEIKYFFDFKDGLKKDFLLKINKKTLKLEFDENLYSSFWTKLDFFKCPHCTLSSDSYLDCPLSLNVSLIMDAFKDYVSYLNIEVIVESNQRSICADTTLQRGISSLMGLAIAASGCPYTSFLKPMARFHLPFANEEETIYRAASTYLLMQYFASKDNDNPDFEMDWLAVKYKDIQKVNFSMAERLRSAIKEDSALNALTLLDLFAKAIPYEIEDSLDEIRYLYDAFRS